MNKKAVKPSKAAWVSEVRNIIDKHREEKKPYSVSVCDTDIKVFPQVFSPKYFPETQWFAKEVLKFTGNKKFLEIGCGAGALVLLAAINGATVSATDINKEAVTNTIANLEIYGMKGDIYLGSLFEPIKEDTKFDIIFWNHPFYRSDTKETDLLIQSCEDYDYNNLRNYISSAKSYLRKDGKVLLGSGDFADIDEIERITSLNNAYLKELAREEFIFNDGPEKFLEEYIIYEIEYSID